MRRTKTLIRLRRCAGWSESSKSTHGKLYLLLDNGSNIKGLQPREFLHWSYHLRWKTTTGKQLRNFAISNKKNRIYDNKKTDCIVKRHKTFPAVVTTHGFSDVYFLNIL